MKRKMMALVLAVVMMVAMGTTAFAADSYTISVDTNGDAVTHTYEVYQIFTGTPSNDKLVDLKYGSSYPGKNTNDSVPKSEIDAIGNSSDSLREWIVDKFGTSAGNLGTTVATLDATNTSFTAVPGYYLVLDKSYTATNDTKDAYSAFMVQVVDKNTTFEPKKAVPSVDKLVKDNADDAESGATDGWGETADHEIGETFQSQLTATIPADTDLAAYDSYMVKFNDTMSDGVTFEKINSVKVGNTTLETSDYTCTATANQAGGSWTLTIADLKKVEGVTLDGTSEIKIVVEYNAHLNTAASVNTADGSTENKNTVSLTYSNNPDATGDGTTDTTPEDSVWVFTYGNNGTKTDANGEKLAGAGFTLYSGSATDTTSPEGTPISLYKVGNDYYKYDTNKASEYTGGEVVTEMKTTTDGVFNIKGLDVGTYTLYESTVPDGYVQATNTVFTIEATHAETEGVGMVDLTEATAEKFTTSETIVNYTGSTLPSTGGIGTTLFYVIGAILVIGAGVILVTRRRMSNAK